MNDATTTTPAPPPVPRPRRWPRRLAIAAVVSGALLATGIWYLGRETTLQALAERVARQSGGSIVITGVTGSLYNTMHLGKLVFRSPEQLITAENIDIDWSPLQYLSKGIAINHVHVTSVRIDTLREGPPPTMPVSLAAPFSLQLDDASITRLTLSKAGVDTVITNVHAGLRGNRQQWTLRDASAVSPWGLAKAAGKIGAQRPFKLDVTASLTQMNAAKGQPPAQLNIHAAGDLTSTELAADGQAGKASGDARFILAPFDAVPLRQLAINGKHLDPGFFNPGLPSADLSLTLAARISAERKVKGSVNLDNLGAVGTLDQQLLPLRAIRADLDGSLDALRISEALIDFGGAGKFTGSGNVQRAADATGVASADFVLHTDRLDLKQLHARMKATKIAGDIRLSNKGSSQTLAARLVEAGMRFEADATLANNQLQISRASIAAGTSSIVLSADASLAGERAFKVKASANKFSPSSFGDYPSADINADINAAGVLSPTWKLAASFALRPSRLFDQALTGSGKFNADASHVSGADTTLALGANTVTLSGSFGAPGEKLVWRVDGKQLSAVRKDLYGSVVASGAVTGTMAAPRTSFELDATGLGWDAAARAANAGVLHASGEAWLGEAGKDGKRAAEISAKGSAQAFNPASFGSPLPGSINGNFDLSAKLGASWTGNVNVAISPSTLANSPFWGYAKLAADAQHVSNADVDLHVGPNVANAKGSFGAGADVLEWRVDAPQLGALGANYGGVLRGNGSLSGSMDMPSLKAALEGQNLKFGAHQLKSLKASASVGSGRGAADPLVADLEASGYVNGDTKVDLARLQSTGTRGAHVLRFALRNEVADASGEVQGGFDGATWSGTVASLQNKGPYALALQAPVPLRIAGVPGSGVMGLLKPAEISLRGAAIKLPDGTIAIESLDKNGPHWTSKGAAAGVPLHYVAQFSPTMRENLRGDLTLGAQWALDMQAPAADGAAPVLNGMLHVFREKGDVIAGADAPVVLGLRTLDLRADLVAGSLRTQVELDGTRAGRATIDATAQLVQGRVSTASPLKLAANADMNSIAWLAPLAGQIGLELDGTLKLALTGGGTIGAPTLNGTVNGDKLAVRWAEQGVKLTNGQLAAQLTGDQLVLQRLSFDGIEGHASADGAVRFAGGEASMQLKLVAERLEILSRPDRTVVVSGTSTLVRDNKHFQLDGKFKADRALIELAPQDRPTLSDDVVVIGRGKSGTIEKPASPSMPLSFDIEADLGDAFRLRGMGIDAELTGTVRIRSSARGPRANGSISVASGTYRAYGQNLSIERGVLTFSGPYDNPALNIRAVRRRPDGDQLTETNVEAGVEVRGTALAPVAKLVSTPTVPDSEKLSWLVLGHGMDAVAGNESGVLAAAAGALLGGKGGGFQSRIADTLGLDEVGLSQAKGLESTVVTVGKRLSSRAYLSFEQGATTASSLVKLRYKLNPRITLQFQTGTNTALDVLYSWAFD
ncbi:MAG: translocation/assembly module TamB domain-containing protein [Massilia sp.]